MNMNVLIVDLDRRDLETMCCVQNTTEDYTYEIMNCVLS